MFINPNGHSCNKRDNKALSKVNANIMQKWDSQTVLDQNNAVSLNVLVKLAYHSLHQVYSLSVHSSVMNSV